LAFGRPYRHAAVADRAPGIARYPQVTVDVAARAVGAALDAVDHAVGEQLLVRQLVVGADIEDMDVALAARTGVAGALAGRDYVELLVVRREAEPVRIRDLIFADHKIDAPARINAIAIGRQFAAASRKP